MFRGAMQARQSWQPLHIRLWFWTRSTMENRCRSASPWERSPCT